MYSGKRKQSQEKDKCLHWQGITIQNVQRTLIKKGSDIIEKETEDIQRENYKDI